MRADEHTGRRTDLTKPIVARSNFSNAPESGLMTIWEMRNQKYAWVIPKCLHSTFLYGMGITPKYHSPCTSFSSRERNLCLSVCVFEYVQFRTEICGTRSW
jgi:hypothetical protein